MKRKNLAASFKAAFQGITNTLLEEPAFKYMVVAALLVGASAIIFDMSRTERAILLILAFAVLALELINTLFERVLDIMKPEEDERVRRIKDLMSGLVLLASLGAATIGAVILLPYINEIFRK